MKPKNGTNIGNAVRELAPNTTWRLHEPGNLENLEWLDNPELRPNDIDIMTKTKELDDDPNFPNKLDVKD